AWVVERLPVWRKVFYGWWVLLACTTIHILGAGLFFYGFSVFFHPIILEFGWSSAVMAGAFSLSRLEGGFEGPFVGRLVDRFGARKLLLVGLAITGTFFILMSRIGSVLTMYAVYGLLSLGYNIGYTHAMTAAVANWFVKKRSRAMSIYTLGAGIGGAIVVPLLARLIFQVGWRAASVITGLSLWIIGFPLAIIIRHRPEDRGLHPDGEPIELDQEIDEATTSDESRERVELTEGEVSFTAREAVKMSSFWVFVLAMIFRATLLSSLVVHQIPHLVSIGIPEQTASDILGLMVLMSIPGRIVFGWAGDYYPKKILIAISMFMQCVGIFFLSNARGIEFIYLFDIIYGIGYGGAIPLTAAYRGDLFGRRYYATISGLMSPVWMIGGIAGPIFAGYIYDINQSYKFALDTFTVLALLGAITILFVKKPKPPPRLTHTHF
ncbi:MAG: MFS transporter, partial [Candidatus Bathyarchaeia archaeon]